VLLRELSVFLLESPADTTLQERIWLLGGRTATRYTVIYSDGTVAADSQKDPAIMDNHGRRPEVVAAVAEGRGVATRYSRTLKEDMMYLALPVDDGGTATGVVRTAVPLIAVSLQLEQARAVVIMVAVGATLLALLIGFFVARRVTRPIERMTDVARAIAGGDYDQIVRTKRIDEIGLLADALNTMTVQLRQLETIRRDFIANISHELKTPLTAIRGLVETMIDDKEMDPATHDRFLEKVCAQSNRLTTLVSDLLTISRLESDGADRDFRLFDMREPLNESIGALRSVADSKRITLEYVLPEDPVGISGDAEALRELADNLVGNAIKYTPSGSRVKISLSCDGGWATLDVEDDGIGIAPSDQNRVFERFYRVDKARSRELGGTGLGLSIVKHVALSHGGNVSLRSALGEGSVFRVQIPLASGA
jgi:two-component system phosphate regulon sensor histidine kinase PhoR